MGLYRVTTTAHFDEALQQIEAKYYGATKKVRGAIRYMENKAVFCGISTNRGLRYVSTRAVPGIPSFVLFFNFDDDEQSACLTQIAESPRNLDGYEDDEEWPN